MSPKTWVILTGGILGIITMRLVIGQLLAIVERYPALVDGAFIIIAWVGDQARPRVPAQRRLRPFRDPEVALARPDRRDLRGGVLLRAGRGAPRRRIARRPTRPPGLLDRTTNSASIAIRRGPSAEVGGGHCFCTDAAHMSITTDSIHRSSEPAVRLPGVSRSGSRSLRHRHCSRPGLGAGGQGGRPCAGRPPGRPRPRSGRLLLGAGRGKGRRPVCAFASTSPTRLYPDPASRFQPDGPHGPSEIVDPGAFAWTDGGGTASRCEGQVIYELHVGTFTREGTWTAAAARTAGTGAARDHRRSS